MSVCVSVCPAVCVCVFCVCVCVCVCLCVCVCVCVHHNSKNKGSIHLKLEHIVVQWNLVKRPPVPGDHLVKRPFFCQSVGKILFIMLQITY